MHWNSGIANLAFKLLVTGGTHPRGKTTVNVTALSSNLDTSLSTAGDIFYAANANCMTPSSNFQAARNCTSAAAGSNASKVDLAWDAVGVPGGSGGGGGGGTGTCPAGWSSVTGTVAAGATNRYNYTRFTGLHQFVLHGPSNADLDLYVYRGNALKASSTSATSEESISYSGSADNVRVKAYSGSGDYLLCYLL